MLLAVLLLPSCSSDLEEMMEFQKQEELTATVPVYQYPSATRLAISEDLTNLTWKSGDKFGLYYSGTSSDVSAAFTVKTGGSTVGTFTNEGFTLNKSASYYAFYPYNSSATPSAASMTFTGQTQAANNDAAHIAAKNYMYAKVTTSSTGVPSAVNFKNVGAILQFRLSPAAGTYKSLAVKSSSGKFITAGKLNMTTGAVTSTSTSLTQILALNNITVASGEELVANMLVAPVDLSASKLTLTLTDTSDKTTSVTVSGDKIESGCIYQFSASAGAYASLKLGTSFNTAIKTLVAGTATDYTTVDDKVKSIVFDVNSARIGGVVVSLASSPSKIFANYADGVVTLSTAAPTIRLYSNSSYLFNGFNALTKIEGLTDVNTSNVTDMSYMFRQCKALTSIDLTSFNTSKVTNMSCMFSACYDLTNLDLSSFDTSSVTKMTSMFNKCTSLKSLILGDKFSISGSASLTGMCTSMSTLSNACTVTCLTATGTAMRASSSFPTAPVFTWKYLDEAAPTESTLLGGTSFNKAVKTLVAGTATDYTVADTSVKTIKFVVNSTSTTGTVVSASTSKAPIYASYSSGVLTIKTKAPVIKLSANSSYLLNGFSGVTSIVGLENVNTANVTNMSYMFRQCKALSNLDLKKFNTSKVTNMSCMFSACYLLSNLDLSSFNTPNVLNMTSLFNKCNSLSILKLGEKFVISDKVSIGSMCNEMSTVSNACTITCLPEVKAAMKTSANFPTTPKFSWVTGEPDGYIATGPGYVFE